MNLRHLVTVSLCFVVIGLFGPCLPRSVGDDVAPGGVSVRLDLGEVVNTMRGGIGASWHAIEEPLPYSETADPVFGIKSHGGSGWGAISPRDGPGPLGAD